MRLVVRNLRSLQFQRRNFSVQVGGIFLAFPQVVLQLFELSCLPVKDTLEFRELFQFVHKTIALFLQGRHSVLAIVEVLLKLLAGVAALPDLDELILQLLRPFVASVQLALEGTHRVLEVLLLLSREVLQVLEVSSQLNLFHFQCLLFPQLSQEISDLRLDVDEGVVSGLQVAHGLLGTAQRLLENRNPLNLSLQFKNSLLRGAQTGVAVIGLGFEVGEFCLGCLEGGLEGFEIGVGGTAARLLLLQLE